MPDVTEQFKAGKVEDGFYWIQIKGEEPKIGRKEGEYLDLCGDDVGSRFGYAGWTVDIIWADGPIPVPATWELRINNGHKKNKQGLGGCPLSRKE